jgi:hypothetical protein
MNGTPDVDLVLRDYFAADGFIAPDHVLDVVEERILRQPQQRAWRVLRRDSHVNSYLKPLLAVAAVVVIAVAGFAFLGQPSDSGVGGAASPAPSPSPTPSASPSPAPSAGAVFPEWFTAESGSLGAGILPPGSAATRAFMPGSTFTVPEGWVNDLDVSIAYGLFPDTSANQAEYALTGDMAQGIFMVSVESPYFICEAWEETDGTAAERVAFLVASEVFATSEPVDVTIGGLTGRQVDVRIDPDWTATCPGDPPTSDYSDIRNRVTYLDTPDGIIAISVGSSHPAGHEAFLAEAMPIVESFQFDLGPEASPS